MASIIYLCRNPFRGNGDFLSRCGKCGPCVRLKKWLKTNRIELEMKSAHGAWFCTLTQVQFELDDGRKFGVMTYENVKKFLKRLRKNTGAEIKFVMAEELHRSGVRHWHAILMHRGTVSKRQLEAAWAGDDLAGHCMVRRINGRGAARYVMKYIGKDEAYIVRSSIHLGKATTDKVVAHPLVQAALAAFPKARLRLDGTPIPIELLRSPPPTNTTTNDVNAPPVRSTGAANEAAEPADVSCRCDIGGYQGPTARGIPENAQSERGTQWSAT